MEEHRRQWTLVFFIRVILVFLLFYLWFV